MNGAGGNEGRRGLSWEARWWVQARAPGGGDSNGPLKTEDAFQCVGHSDFPGRGTAEARAALSSPA